MEYDINCEVKPYVRKVTNPYCLIKFENGEYGVMHLLDKYVVDLVQTRAYVDNLDGVFNADSFKLTKEQAIELKDLMNKNANSFNFEEVVD